MACGIFCSDRLMSAETRFFFFFFFGPPQTLAFVEWLGRSVGPSPMVPETRLRSSRGYLLFSGSLPCNQG
jgi:hypothetical protein